MSDCATPTIAGRDRHIVARALAIAISTIERAEPEKRPLSDLHDMKTMLGQLLESDAHLEAYISSATNILNPIN